MATKESWRPQHWGWWARWLSAGSAALALLAWLAGYEAASDGWPGPLAWLAVGSALGLTVFSGAFCVVAGIASVTAAAVAEIGELVHEPADGDPARG